MYPMWSIGGGFLATLGIISLAASGPTSLSFVSSALTAQPAGTSATVDRTNKGDRLAAPRANVRSRVAVVEVVGVSDTAIVYRDREGRVLFRTDPVANVTVITKDVELPEVTVRETNARFRSRCRSRLCRKAKRSVRSTVAIRWSARSPSRPSPGSPDAASPRIAGPTRCAMAQ